MKGELGEVIKECEKMIYKLASNYSMYSSVDDLYQAGCLGIIRAYENFDSSYNTKFSTYAYSYIIGEMIDNIFFWR